MSAEVDRGKQVVGTLINALLEGKNPVLSCALSSSPCSGRVKNDSSTRVVFFPCVQDAIAEHETCL
jgi:hypothetical protein